MLALLRDSLRVGDRWGLDWWVGLGVDGPTTRDVAAWESVRVSLGYAVAAVLIAVLVGGAAACAIAYTRRGSTILDSGLMLPLGTSAVTLGFGLLITFSVAPVDLRGRWIIVPIGQALVAIPLVVRTVLPVLRAIDPRLREVAATLGSSPLTVWRTIDLPVFARALGVGAGFAAAVSLGEFGATSFLARTDAPTLPVRDRPAALAARRGQRGPGRRAVRRAGDRHRARGARDRAAAAPGIGGVVSVGLELVGVSATLDGYPVLDGVDLHVEPPESVALLGPSGIGKSTLLRVVSGLVRPDAGTVSWDGVDLADTPPHRRGIGLVFQDAVLFPHLDVASNVGLPAGAVLVAGPATRGWTSCLALVDLDGYGDREVDTLSGGQAQRVALARALAADPGSCCSTSRSARWTRICGSGSARRCAICCAGCGSRPST